MNKINRIDIDNYIDLTDYSKSDDYYRGIYLLSKAYSKNSSSSTKKTLNEIFVNNIQKKMTRKGSYEIIVVIFWIYVREKKEGEWIGQFSNQKKASGGSIFYIHPYNKDYPFNIKRCGEGKFVVGKKNKSPKKVSMEIEEKIKELEMEEKELDNEGNYLITAISNDKGKGFFRNYFFNGILINRPDHGDICGGETTVIFTTGYDLDNSEGFRDTWDKNFFVYFGPRENENPNISTFKRFYHPLPTHLQNTQNICLFKEQGVKKKINRYFFRCGVPAYVKGPQTVFVSIWFIESGCCNKFNNQKDRLIAKGCYTYEKWEMKTKMTREVEIEDDDYQFQKYLEDPMLGDTVPEPSSLEDGFDDFDGMLLEEDRYTQSVEYSQKVYENLSKTKKNDSLDVYNKNFASYCCETGVLDLVKALHEEKYDFNHKDVFGRTPLFIAAYFQKKEIVEYLKHVVKVKTDLKNNKGMNYLEYSDKSLKSLLEPYNLPISFVEFKELEEKLNQENSIWNFWNWLITYFTAPERTRNEEIVISFRKNLYEMKNDDIENVFTFIGFDEYPQLFTIKNGWDGVTSKESEKALLESEYFKNLPVEKQKLLVVFLTYFKKCLKSGQKLSKYVVYVAEKWSRHITSKNECEHILNFLEMHSSPKTYRETFLKEFSNLQFQKDIPIRMILREKDYDLEREHIATRALDESFKHMMIESNVLRRSNPKDGIRAAILFGPYIFEFDEKEYLFPQSVLYSEVKPSSENMWKSVQPIDPIVYIDMGWLFNQIEFGHDKIDKISQFILEWNITKKYKHTITKKITKMEKNEEKKKYVEGNFSNSMNYVNQFLDCVCNQEEREGVKNDSVLQDYSEKLEYNGSLDFELILSKTFVDYFGVVEYMNAIENKKKEMSKHIGITTINPLDEPETFTTVKPKENKKNIEATESPKIMKTPTERDIISGIKIVVKTHIGMDNFANHCVREDTNLCDITKGRPLYQKLPELFLMKAIDRAFWVRHMKEKDEDNTPIYHRLPGYEGIPWEKIPVRQRKLCCVYNKPNKVITLIEGNLGYWC